MLGPAAPKDPEKQRSFFYIMRQKSIYGSKQEDGTGIQFLYQSDGRLESSASVVGNVEDKEMIELMGTVDGLKKLVHSIGISIEMDNPSDTARFVFQMYGKEDLYGGGTNLIADLKGDGNEKRIYLGEVNWTEDDNIPGQIKVIMEKPDLTASISVRFYLNDGFVAPAQEEESKVDTSSAEYRAMISKSLIQTGNTKRLNAAIKKAKSGADVTLAYIGGSITQGAGATPINTMCYAFQSFQKLKQMMGQGDNVHFIKAGVGGTPSELGMLRFDRDVLRDGEKPDLVVVEFAVNDAGDETEGDCYESLVRKILALEWKPAVILLFSVFADDYNLEERLIPVGLRYDLPMISVKRAVTPQFYDKENRLVTKNQFFYDMFHPTNLGHEIMADCLKYLAEESVKKSDAEYDPKLEAPAAIGKTFDTVQFFDRKDIIEGVEIIEGGFKFTDTVLQSVEMDLDLKLTPEFPNNWMYDGLKDENSVFTMKLNCKSLVIIMKDSGEVDAAKATAYVDGKEVRLLDPYVNRWLHCNPLILINEDTAAEHVVEIRVNKEDVDKKFTILGFGLTK